MRLTVLLVGLIFLPAMAVGGDTPDDVAALVAQLGDPKFAKREAAQKALLRRGDAVLPELEKFAGSPDAEIAERIRKIRYELVGYLDEIRQHLVDVDDRPDHTPAAISADLRRLIEKNQPRSGDLLISLIADTKHELHRRALRSFLQTWPSATPTQLDRFLQLRIYLETVHRPKFPAKVGALVPFESKIRDGWGGWFQSFIDNEFARCPLDAEQEPFASSGPIPVAVQGLDEDGDLQGNIVQGHNLSKVGGGSSSVVGVRVGHTAVLRDRFLPAIERGIVLKRSGELD